MSELAAVVLAAGAGTRLRPLTRLRPKALCPVDNVPLVDLAVGWARVVTSAVAVNVHHGRAAMESHLAGRVHLSVEEPVALGTAGGVAKLKDWVDGRSVLTTNVDAWHDADLEGFARQWDGERVRVLVASERAPERSGGAQLQTAARASLRGVAEGDPVSEFGPRARVVASLLPWRKVASLEPRPTGLYEVCWRPAFDEGRLDVVRHGGAFFDCGTPGTYLAANMAASDGRSVIGPGAHVEGAVEESVVWPGAVVRRGEHLRRAIRAHDRLTVLARQ